MIFPMFPLQVDITAFWKENTGSPSEIIGFVVILVVVIAFVIYINRSKGKVPAVLSSGSTVFTDLFSRIKTHRIARRFGLKREQIKMLDFVFKTDEVTDPEKSFHDPVLLDRHFRRAYREIEQSASSEEEAQNRLTLLFSTRNILENNVGDVLTSTSQLKENTTLIINHDKDKLSVPVVSAGGEQLVVRCPTNALGSPLKFHKGNKLTAFIFTKNNRVFSFETRVIGDSSESGKDTLLLTHSHQLNFLSQRRYRRKQTAIPCNIFIVIVEGSGKKQRLIVDKRRLMGNIADISVGGCSIKTKAHVQVGARLKIEFTQGKANVAAVGQVLRTNHTGMVIVIHIKFLKVTRKSLNIINAFVYEYAYG